MEEEPICFSKDVDREENRVQPVSLSAREIPSKMTKEIVFAQL